MDEQNLLKLLNERKWFDKKGRINSNKISSTSPEDLHIKQLLVLQTCFLPETSSLKERIFCLKNAIKQRPKCSHPQCNNFVEFVGEKNKPYRQYCSVNCMQNDPTTIEKKKQTTKLHYGVESPAKNPEILKLMQKTSFERYGVHNAMLKDEFKIKQQKTMQNKYGVTSPRHSTTIEQKRLATIKQKYGGDSPLANPQIQEKSKQTLLKTIGVEKPFKSQQIQQKCKQTLFERYGVNHVSKIPGVNLRRKQTNIQRYGVESHSQRHIHSTSLQKLRDKQWLEYQHHVVKLPLCSIAENLGVSSHAVERRFKLYGIEVKTFFTSTFHREIVEFIRKNYGGMIVENSRNVIPPFELDIFLPELNIAIEANGVFWHGELNGKHKYYHFNKTKQCFEKQIQLFHILDIEWYNQQEIVKSKILSVLGITKQINAKHCAIQTIDSQKANTFFRQNDIKGYKIGKINFGMFYKGQLIAVMSFDKNNDNYQLVNFCEILYTTTQNGFNELLNQFVNIYKPKAVVCCCDMRYPTNEMFEQSGFIFQQWIEPKSKYFKRTNPSQLFEQIEITQDKEHKIMYDKIWDSGYIRYVKTF